ncbi:CoA transferase, partial [Arthrospira platensis SPKY1]|nr:CoA transferase [Arthrospira platensis SPKY1]
NALYGAFGNEFATADGRKIMLVGLTRRQWDGIRKVTGLHAELDALGQRLGLNLNLEGDRFKARHEITALLEPWFRARKVEDFAEAFDKNGVTWSVFRSFKQVVAEDPDCSPRNPMFERVEQPGIGNYLV